MPPKPAAFLGMQLLARLRALALLVGNAAAGLAGRLAGSLALAAAAVLGAVAQVAGFKRLDMLHDFSPSMYERFSVVYHSFGFMSIVFHTFHTYVFFLALVRRGSEKEFPLCKDLRYGV